ncbi:hypothetical protein PVAP13_4NG277876 [Panicum virgatum]|uniref:Uncharacterized protein n=1 Tax=Panicum virgatum TaxID=38727 RepID=A0A8T0TDB5_PANVG|nr:hypothetical protein PVAP13_4NG277876 [Panicum virgatum]
MPADSKPGRTGPARPPPPPPPPPPPASSSCPHGRSVINSPQAQHSGCHVVLPRRAARDDPTWRAPIRCAGDSLCPVLLAPPVSRNPMAGRCATGMPRRRKERACRLALAFGESAPATCHQTGRLPGARPLYLGVPQ